MFRNSSHAPHRWGRAFVAALCLSLLVLLPGFLETHHTCHLQLVQKDASLPSVSQQNGESFGNDEIRSFCASCALLRTLIANQEESVVYGAYTASSAWESACSKDLIAAMAVEDTSSPRGPPSV